MRVGKWFCYLSPSSGLNIKNVITSDLVFTPRLPAMRNPFLSLAVKYERNSTAVKDVNLL
jgi:hypothetical protein